MFHPDYLRVAIGGLGDQESRQEGLQLPEEVNYVTVEPFSTIRSYVDKVDYQDHVDHADHVSPDEVDHIGSRLCPTSCALLVRNLIIDLLL